MARRGTPIPWPIRETIGRLLRGGPCDYCANESDSCRVCGGAGIRPPQSRRSIAKELRLARDTVRKYAARSLGHFC